MPSPSRWIGSGSEGPPRCAVGWPHAASAAASRSRLLVPVVHKDKDASMLRIRLRRTGAKKKPTYRVVVADARAPRDGAFLDILGHYNPRTEPSTVVIDAAKAQKWLSHGAQPSERVAKLFKREGIAPGKVVEDGAA